jgi:serine phosphatase RsbU (regulator of sigma subunit)/anti-sigma regulatory factor (Ser/Thr protein kinase)
VHGTGSVDEKLAWVLDAVRVSAGTPLAAYLAAGPGAGPPDTGDLELIGAPGLRSIVSEPVALHVRSAGAGLGVLGAPVLGADRRRYGVLAAGVSRDEQPDAAGLDAVAALAAHLGVALDAEASARVRRDIDAAQRESVHQLQEAVRPPVPVVAETELGVHYLAADPATPTGGDLYDWQVLPDGNLHIAIVDVMGKGVAATKDALTVTHALRMLVFEGVPLAHVVSRADRVISEHHPELVATLIVGRYDPETGRLQLAGGGHPPALLINAQGETELIEAPGIPLGWPGAGSDGVLELKLDRSDTIVLYTDGLIEATKDIEEGLAGLQAAGREVAAYPAGSLAQALVERALEGAERRDDTLTVVLRRRIPPAAGPEQPLLRPFRHQFKAASAAVPIARHLLADWLGHQPMDRGAVDDLMIVAGELCALAVRGDGGAVVLGAHVDGGAMVLTVEAEGTGLPPDAADYPRDAPDPGAESGRGPFLARVFSDELSVDATDGRTVVTCIKRAVLATG